MTRPPFPGSDRRRALLTLILLPIAACAEAQPNPRGPREQNCAQNEAQFEALIGRDVPSAEAALRAMPGIVVIRAVGPNSPVTMDYRADRATVLVVNRRVQRITCG